MHLPAFAVLLQLMCSGDNSYAGVRGSCALTRCGVWEARPSNVLPGVLPESCKHVSTPLDKPDAMSLTRSSHICVVIPSLVGRYMPSQDRSSNLYAGCRQNGAGETGTSRGLEDSKTAAPAAGAAEAKTEAAEDADASRPANAAGDAFPAAMPGAVVKEEAAAAVKQEDPGIAANGGLALKPEPLNGQAGRPGDAGAAASAAGISPGQQAKQISGESTQGAAAEAEPCKAESAGMQNGITAVKPEEVGKQAGEGNGQTGHESDEESDLEDEEEEHDDQVCAAWSRRFCREHDVSCVLTTCPAYSSACK